MEWKTIESAPHDWTDIILHVPDLDCDFRTVCEGYFDTEISMWRSPLFGAVRPTHWMPLPEPPNA